MKRIASTAFFLSGYFAVLLMPGCGVEKPAEIVEAEQHVPEEVDFNLHVKPILSDRCFACHGPDNNARKAGLRLDTEAGAFAWIGEEKDHRAIVPSNLRKSAIYSRITSTDPETMMPPPESNLVLSNKEKAIIIRWIEQGAEWKKHWAFIPPVKSETPEVRDKTWPRNEIDKFVLSKLESEGIEPSSRTDKTTLLRRLSFDLTGLPPTPEDIQSFVKDNSPDAYEKRVDKLLASEAYAERWAMEWMDVARYADSHGYHADGYRMMWPWRDWVIKAFNENMPFDQFITWQIAGDLLPNASEEQILATAFNRNHPMTAEGGIIDEEYRLEYVFDRTNTTSRALLGITMECAQCHDHKYDPLSQKEFYQLSAFYNNLNEIGMTGDDGNAGPVLQLPDEDTRKKLDYINAKITSQEKKLEERSDQLASKFNNSHTRTVPSQQLRAGLTGHYPLDQVYDKITKNKVSHARHAVVKGDPELIEGVKGKALRSKDDYDILELESEGLFEINDPFSIAFWVKPEEYDQYQELFGNAGGKNSYWRGYEAYLDSLNHIEVKLIHAKPHNIIHVRSTDAIPLNEWSHIVFAYAGNTKASGIAIYIDGKPVDTEVLQDNLYKSMLPVDKKYEKVNRPLRFGRSYSSFTGDDGIFTGSFDDIRVYNRKLTAPEVALLYDVYDTVDSKAPATFKSETWAEYHARNTDQQSKNIRSALRMLRMEKLELLNNIKEVMVMKEMDEPRKTYVLERGEYDAPQEEVRPVTPEIIMPFADTLPQNRLGLAQWLTHPQNPLVARVTVNRYWHNIFGRGIVGTVEDFGNQGDLPSHPLLLDWLAVEFIASGWDLKAMLKKIVMSATYRQSSAAGEELLKKDPENILLGRGPKHRLPGEMIRDNAVVCWLKNSVDQV